MDKLEIRYFLIISTLLIFFTGTICAYSDFGINDITLHKSITVDQNLDLNISLVNNSSSDETININVSVVAPNGNILITSPEQQLVPANSIGSFYKVFNSGVIDLNYSNQPYHIFALITNDSGNSSNNSYTKYFVVRKSSKKLPVPDMPIYFSFIVASLSLLFIFSKKTRVENYGRKNNKKIN